MDMVVRMLKPSHRIRRLTVADIIELQAYGRIDAERGIAYVDGERLRYIGTEKGRMFHYFTPDRVLLGWLVVAWFRLSYKVSLTWRLLLRIAEVWGLADGDPAAILTWRDLKIVKWLMRKRA